jgi:integrase
VFERLVCPHEISRRQIEEIGRSDIAGLSKIEASRGARMAHLTLLYLSALFNWYVTRTDAFRNPIVRAMSPIKAKERAGTRVLADPEIHDIWGALDKAEIPQCFCRLVRTLLLTGLRRTEAARASWRDIEYLRRDDYQGDVLTIPAARMKGKQDHAVPLTPRILALLGHRPKAADVKAYPFVFSTDARRPLAVTAKPKPRSTEK